MAHSINNERSWIEINLTNYEDNLRELKRFIHPHQNILQIVKADAYGHGAYQIAKCAIKNGVSMLGVANLDEALLIRYQEISSPILILSPSLESEIEKIVIHDFIPSVNDLPFAKKLNDTARSYNKLVKIHINIDTGMNRSGVRADQALSFISQVASLSNLVIDGLFTHYAESESNFAFTTQQYQVFCNTIDQIKTKFPDLEPTYLHSSNSCATVNFDFPRMNLVRLGILSFGIYPHKNLESKISIKPVMRYVTKISQLKTAKEDEYIGYNLTYKAQKSLEYAILPIGYADGYNYLLKNKGKVQINDLLLPVLGKVTMDMIMIDVSQIADKSIGQEVTLFGTKELRIEDLTSLYEGSPYELSTQIGKRAKRFYYYDNEEIATEPRLRRDFYSPDFSANKLTSVIKNALKSRISSNELSQVLFSEIIADFIKESDKNISYKTDFCHKIKFSLSNNHPDFYQVTTELSYTKLLNYKNFIIACTANQESLDKYFKNPQVEYRWLLPADLILTRDSFILDEVTVNNISAEITTNSNNNILEYNCFNKDYASLIGKRCNFSIKTTTLYPRNSHQLSVFISEPTKGVSITFEYPDNINEIDTVTLFSGQSKYPFIKKENHKITVESEKESWILATSGVIFSF